MNNTLRLQILTCGRAVIALSSCCWKEPIRNQISFRSFKCRNLRMTHWYPSQSGSSNSPFSFQHCFMVDYFNVSLPDMSSWWKVLQTSHGQTPAPQDTHRWDCTPPQEQQLDLKQGATCTISRSNKIIVPLGPNPIKFMRACPENWTLWTIFGPKRWKKWGYGSSSFTCSIHPSASHPILWQDDQQKCLWTK